jgi:stage IV sporulation protein FB
MKYSIKLFNFRGTPVYLKLWFLLLFFWLNPSLVLILFISVLLHELGHAYLGQKFGYEVHSVEIDFFGGLANMDIDKIHNRDLVKIVAAGPWVNAMLASFFVLINSFVHHPFISQFALVNFVLFIFNIIPIFPLDGGRILRTMLIIKTGNVARSIKITGVISLILSIALLIFYIFNFSLFMIVFCLIFIIFACKDLGFIKA